MSAHNTGRRLAEKELSAWTRTREPGSPLLVSRYERHTQEEEEVGGRSTVFTAATSVRIIVSTRFSIFTNPMALQESTPKIGVACVSSITDLGWFNCFIRLSASVPNAVIDIVFI